MFWSYRPARFCNHNQEIGSGQTRHRLDPGQIGPSAPVIARSEGGIPSVGASITVRL